MRDVTARNRAFFAQLNGPVFTYCRRHRNVHRVINRMRFFHSFNSFDPYNKCHCANWCASVALIFMGTRVYWVRPRVSIEWVYRRSNHHIRCVLHTICYLLGFARADIDCPFISIECIIATLELSSERICTTLFIMSSRVCWFLLIARWFGLNQLSSIIACIKLLTGWLLRRYSNYQSLIA